MVGMTVYPRLVRWCYVAVCIVVLASCARMPSTGKAPIQASTFAQLQSYLIMQPPQLDTFRLSGPFEVAQQNNYEFALAGARSSSANVLKADLFFASHKERAPLVVIVHGHGASKEMHAYQAMHLATWGLHALTLQMPNEGPWVDNALKLHEIVSAIVRGSALADPRIDTSRIILAGHSFGASSVAVALAEGVPALGGILLDPATTERAVPVFLGKNKMPLLILGADEQSTVTTNRGYFFNYAHSRVYELSIKDAIHEDAQFPAADSKTTEALQFTFAGAMTAAAMSLALTQRFDYAWSIFDSSFKNGTLLRPKTK